MYGLFASATLVLALLSEGTRAALHGVLNDYGISTEAVNGGVKHVRVEDNVVKVKARSGMILLRDHLKSPLTIIERRDDVFRRCEIGETSQ